ALCTGQSLTIVVPDTFDSFQWSIPPYYEQAYTINTQGTYRLTVSKNGCAVTDTLDVEILDPDFVIGGNTTLCNGDEMTLTANSLEGSEYTWQDGSTGNKYRVTLPGIYEVTATNSCGTFTRNATIGFRQCECN